MLHKLLDSVKFNRIKNYDMVVIGSGAGLFLVEKGIGAGFSVALICKGPAGGTCLNVGCIPSKLLLAAADAVVQIKEAQKFGIDAQIHNVDFSKIMEDIRSIVIPDHDRIRENLKSDRRFDYYEGTCEFIDPNTLKIDDQTIKGKSIFIAAGVRPLIPSIQGIDTVEYLTNESLLELNKLPESLAIIGGGYIAAEYGHFFSAMGSDVTIIQKNKHLVPAQEPEISELLKEIYQTRMNIHTDALVQKIEKTNQGYQLTWEDQRTGEKSILQAEYILIAAGRSSNADILQVANAGIETDEQGFIKTDEHLKTNLDNIFAIGDINGKKMFTHVAYKEAELAWYNSQNEHQRTFDYSSAPHAVFSYPQIASVGLTEKQARQDHEILVGKAHFNEVAKGLALKDYTHFTKAIVEKETYRILGFHIIGPNASILLQEVVNAMTLGGDLSLISENLHIHPAMSEIIIRTFNNLMPA